MLLPALVVALVALAEEEARTPSVELVAEVAGCLQLVVAATRSRRELANRQAARDI